MLIRIVRMTFQPDRTADFLAIFAGAQPRIRAFAGCHWVELWQDADQPHVYCTHSHWESAAALENYRQSDLFVTTWAQTKVLFAEKPLAFSVNAVRVSS